MIEAQPDIPGLQTEAMFVLSMYGATMLSVQAFERVLGALTLALDAKPWRDRRFKSPEHMRRHLGRLFSRSIHRFQRASASELLKMLPDQLDEDLITDLDTLVRWRDRLAHRYLVEKLVLGGAIQFDDGTVVELLKVGQQFTEVSKRLTEMLMATISSWPKDDATPPEVVELFASLARPLMFGEKWQPPGAI